MEMNGWMLGDEVEEGSQLSRVYERDEGKDDGEGIQVEHHDHRRDPVWSSE